jgi:signal peptidase II
MWLLIAVGIMLDQLIKLWVASVMVVGEPVNLFYGLTASLAMNRGVAFSMFASSRGFWFSLLIAAISVFNWMLIEWLHAAREESFTLRLSLSLIITGGISNMIDRLCYGAVVDYLLLDFGVWQWPAIFNLADVWVTLGGVLLIVHHICHSKAKQLADHAALSS